MKVQGENRMEDMTVYKYLKKNGDSDIGDATFDTEFDCTWYPADGPLDSYDRVLMWMEKGIRYDREKKGFDMAGFAKEHLDLFKRLSEKYCSRMYQVKGDDDDSIYNAVCAIQCLSSGEFANSAYKWLDREIKGE